MPGENIQDWSVTATNNGNADSSINWAEGQARASVNNSARSMMAAHAKNRNLQNGSIVTGGSANAQTFTSGVTYTTVPTGLRVLLKIGPGLTNTGAATLEMDGLGAVAIKDQVGGDLAASMLLNGAYAEFIYSGTNWVLFATLTAPTRLVGERDASIANTAWVGAEVPAIMATELPTILASRAMFRAGVASSQVIPASTPFTVFFASEAIDIGGLFVGDVQWVPPAGRVLLTTTLGMSTADATGCVVTIAFWKNGAASGLGQNFIIPANVFLGGTTATTMDVADGTSSYRVAVTFDRGGTVQSGSFSGMLM